MKEERGNWWFKNKKAQLDNFYFNQDEELYIRGKHVTSQWNEEKEIKPTQQCMEVLRIDCHYYTWQFNITNIKTVTTKHDRAN